MNPKLAHISLHQEDGDYWHAKDARDGKVFPIAKKGLSKKMFEDIAQHFAGGGEVGLGMDSTAMQSPFAPENVQTSAADAYAEAKAREGTQAALRADMMSRPNPYLDSALSVLKGGPTLAALRPGAPRPDAKPVEVSSEGADQMSPVAGFTPVPEGGPSQPAPQPPPMATPPRPRGAGAGSNLERDAIKAEQDKVKLAEDIARSQGAIQQDFEAKKQAAGQQWQQRWQDNQARADRLQQDIANGQIDPGRFWQSKDLGGKVAASIALVLGGLSQGFNGGPNPALAVIEKAIDRDIDAQKTDLGKKQNLLTHYVQQGHDLQSAMQLAKADMQDAYAGQMQRMATDYAPKEAGIHAQEAIVGIKQNAAAARSKAHQQGFENTLKVLELNQKAAATAASAQNKVPAKEAADIGGFKSAADQVDSLLKLRGEKTGAVSGATQYLPGTDAAQYRDAQQLAGQAVGLMLEGGKLSDRDKPFYMDLMPTAGDSDERAKAKVANVKDMLARKSAREAEALGAAGFNTQGLQQLAQPPKTKEQGRAEMLQWATANKGKDPKADEMLQLLGVQ